MFEILLSVIGFTGLYKTLKRSEEMPLFYFFALSSGFGVIAGYNLAKILVNF